MMNAFFIGAQVRSRYVRFCTLGVSQIEGVEELGGRAHQYVHSSGKAGEAHGADKSPVQRGKGNKDEGYLCKCVFFSYFADRL